MYECSRCLAKTDNPHGLLVMGDNSVDGCEHCRWADTATAHRNAMSHAYADLEEAIGMVIPAELKAQGLSFEELLFDMGIDPDGVLSGTNGYD